MRSILVARNMKLKHHDLEVELDDAWWAEAGMEAFVPATSTYAADESKTPGRRIFCVSMNDIAPVYRNSTAGVFNDNSKQTARESVVSILRCFVVGVQLPPVEVMHAGPEDLHRYKLKHGVHRLYCSLAAGFLCVPAVLGINLDD